MVSPGFHVGWAAPTWAVPDQPRPEVGLPGLPPGSHDQPVNVIQCGPTTPAVGTEIAHFLPFILTCWGCICQNNLTAVPSRGKGQRHALGNAGRALRVWQRSLRAATKKSPGLLHQHHLPRPGHASPADQDRDAAQTRCTARRAHELRLTKQMANSGLSLRGAGKAPWKLYPLLESMRPSLHLLPGCIFGEEPGLKRQIQRHKAGP